MRLAQVGVWKGTPETGPGVGVRQTARVGESLCRGHTSVRALWFALVKRGEIVALCDANLPHFGPLARYLPPTHRSVVAWPQRHTVCPTATAART